MPLPEELLHELDLTLTDQGFTVTVDLRLWAVEVKNPAASYLQQVVRLGGKDGTPFWFWEWSGPERDSPATYEPVCPAPDIGKIAEQVARVLALAATR